MKGLKKLVLATAVAAAPFAQAELTAMDDSFLEGMTGQAGITLDINLDMNIEEIRYADEDGYGEDINDGGYLTLSKIKIFGDQGTANDQALIKGVTIDVDKDDGIVIGFGQIGGVSDEVGTNAAAAVIASNYWTGVNITTDFGINGTQAGSLEIKNFTNFVPNALALEGVIKFGYDLVDSTGNVTAGAGGAAGNTLNAAAIVAGSAGTIDMATAQVMADDMFTKVALVVDGDATLGAIANATSSTGLIAQEYAALGGGGEAVYETAKENVLNNTDAATVTAGSPNGFAQAVTAGTHIDASVSITAGGAVGEGLTISAVVGFVIEEMTFSDDGLAMGIHNFTMYDTDAGTGAITGFTVDDLTIDVVSRAADENSASTAALQIAGLTTNGTIAMGDIFIGDHTTGSIGSVAIRDIDMSNTQILIYGH